MLASSKLWRNASGAALVEFSVVLPVLLLLGFGAFEFSNALYGRHVIATGLRDGARYLARVEDPTSASAQANAKQIAVFGQIGGTTRRLAWWGSDDVTVTVTPLANPKDPETGTRPYRGRDPLYIVRLSTAATYPGFQFVGAAGLTPGLTVNVYHEERSIGE
jgi:hypothetical protein